MQITPQILSIPPYLSTSWENIASLRSEQAGSAFTLYATLKNGDIATVPGLSTEEVQSIFDAHAQYSNGLKFPMPFSFSVPFKPAGPLTSLGNSMRHNSEQSDLPEIPPEILNKVAIIAKAFGFDDVTNLEAPEPDCNCMYCQIHRAFSPKEERISDADLAFRDWEIKEVSDKLYTVTSPLDPNEQYNVYLGETLGCTCGQKNCEHLKAVLHS